MGYPYAPHPGLRLGPLPRAGQHRRRRGEGKPRSYPLYPRSGERDERAIARPRVRGVWSRKAPPLHHSPTTGVFRRGRSRKLRRRLATSTASPFGTGSCTPARSHCSIQKPRRASRSCSGACWGRWRGEKNLLGVALLRQWSRPKRQWDRPKKQRDRPNRPWGRHSCLPGETRRHPDRRLSFNLKKVCMLRRDLLQGRQECLPHYHLWTLETLPHYRKRGAHPLSLRERVGVREVLAREAPPYPSPADKNVRPPVLP